jgi:CRP/FNR family transcriptional regulator, nitrogen oxide reductase regulator
MALSAFVRAPLFAGLREPDLVDLAARFHPRHFARDEALFHEGHRAHAYYLIAEGRVKIIQTSVDGTEVILHLLGPGELVGALPNLDDGTYPGSALALDDVSALSITPGDFEALLERHPRLAINLLRFAASKLRSAHDRLRELTTERAERRLARTISRLAAQIGRRVEAGVLLDAPLTRQALAELSGTSLFTVSRTLKEWERQGLLQIGRERVVIVNTHALAMRADDLPLPVARPVGPIPHA